MLISLNWIKRYIDLTQTDPQKICDILTEKSAEVEEIIFQGKDLENIVVGKILEISAHPEADKIQITKTEVGNGEILQIICGGSNISEGMMVPVALPGAVLPGNFAIKKGKIRGVDSNGMLCGADEIGVSAVEGKAKIWDQEKAILEILGDVKLGTPLAEYLGMDDVIFEIENTSITNRADQFSHIGFAREFVACGLGKYKKDGEGTAGDISGIRNLTENEEKLFAAELQKADGYYSEKSYPLIEVHKKNVENLPVEISFPESAEKVLKSYAAISITGVDGTTKSPEYIQKALISVGIEPRNALIDITNFVMFEFGIPTHAFDLDQVGKKWKWRLSKNGEKMSTLNKEEISLPDNAIIIEDENGEIFDLVGINGGKNSGIINSTKNILIQAPICDPVKIRRASLAVGLRTDASVIYEKNVPAQLASLGMWRVVDIVKEIFPNAEISAKPFTKNFSDEKGDINTPRKILKISLEKISSSLGIEISEQEVTKILQSLGFWLETSLCEGGMRGVNISVPYWRSDINIPEDILEEIARIYGLNKIPAIAPKITLEEKKTLPIRVIEKKIVNTLIQNGCYEILTLSFYGKKLLQKMEMPENTDEQIRVKNPLGEELEIMRTSLSPRLFEVAEKNSRYQENFRIFESGKIFSLHNGEKIETHRITGIFVGDDFLSAKAIAEEIFEEFGMQYRMQEKKYELSFAHPGRGAVMTVGRDASIKIFEVHPKISKKFGLPKNSSILCMDIKNFEPLLSKTKKVSALPKFPGIDYDVSVICEENLPVEKLIKNISRLDPLVTRAEVESIWRGEGVEENKKSVTLSFTFQSPERTLEDKEAKNLEKKILAEVEKRGGVFRF